jgi:hypothetical protein
MVNHDSTLRLPMFHGTGKDDVDQHWFTCEVIWYVKRIRDEASKIAQLETIFGGNILDVVHEVQGHCTSGTNKVPDINQARST